MTNLAQIAAKSSVTLDRQFRGGSLGTWFCAGIATLVVAGAAHAQVYGDEVGCAMLAGERPVSDNMYLYDGKTVQRMESSCPVTGSLQVGSGGILLTVECSGEGETWEDYYLLSTTSDPNHYIIHPSDFPEFATDIYACEIE